MIVDDASKVAKTPRELFERYAPAVAYLRVRNAAGDELIGTAFHVGDGVFLTARHVVEDHTLIEIATTVGRHVPDRAGLTTILGREGKYRSVLPAKGRVVRGPLLHPDRGVDVAAVVVEGLDLPFVRLGAHLDDWISDDDFLLLQVIVLGYPRVPFSKRPTLVVARAEVNAVIDKYTGGHPHFIISTMARGGFSGGPCLVDGGAALGLVTESLGINSQPAELGFMSVISVEPLFVCMQHHGIVPAVQKEGWGDFWDGPSGYQDDEP